MSEFDHQLDAILDQFESDWIEGRQPPVADYLKKGDAEVRLDLLKELISLDIEYRLKKGYMVTANDYADFGEEAVAIADQVFATIVKTVTPDGEDAVTSLGQSTSDGQRFVIRRLLERGGLGVVSVALDKELNREVALKEIRADCADNPTFRSKFMLEAEVTGGLEHPGIVPVYGLGTAADGRPYYAMRLIKGDNLRQHIKRFHEAVAAGNEFFDGPALRKLMRRLLDVCHAIEYAHGRGVLHRDLKPSNIMLGKYGETLVVDWGLAKPNGAKQRNGRTGVVEPEPTLTPSGSNDAATAHGSILGTAAYAPPEQLSGDLESVTTQSDIYGLGAILYELLAGQPPASGETLADIIRIVVAGDIKPPQAVQPQVPKPLAAICMRAIALRAVDRYETAAELGQEIERWLDDTPISAYSEPISVRIRRWMRKHPAVVATSSAVVLMSMIGLGLFSSIVSRSNDQLASKNVELKAANQSEIAARKKVEEAESGLKEQLSETNRQLERSQLEEGRTWLERARTAREKGDHLAGLMLAGRAVGFQGYGRREKESPELEEAYPLLLGKPFKFDPSVEKQRQTEVAEINKFVRSIQPTTLPIWSNRANAKQKDEIETVAFSPNGVSLASGSRTGKIQFWHVATGSNMWTLDGHTDPIKSIAFSPDGVLLASSSEDGSVKIWDVATGNERLTFTAHKGGVNSVAFSPDGSQLASGSEDGRVKLWDVSTGKESSTIVVSRRDTSLYSGTVAISPDGKQIASGCESRIVRVWDIATGKELSKFEAVIGLGRSVAFSPDCYLACGGWSEIHVWDPGSDKNDKLWSLTGHTNYVVSLSFSPNGELLASGSWDGTAKLWDIMRGKELSTFVGPIGEVNSVAFSPDGNSLAIGCSDGTVMLLDVSMSKDSKTPKGNMLHTIDLFSHLREGHFGIGREGVLWPAQPAK